MNIILVSLNVLNFGSSWHYLDSYSNQHQVSVTFSKVFFVPHGMSWGWNEKKVLISLNAHDSYLNTLLRYIYSCLFCQQYPIPTEWHGVEVWTWIALHSTWMALWFIIKVHLLSLAYIIDLNRCNLWLSSYLRIFSLISTWMPLISMVPLIPNDMSGG